MYAGLKKRDDKMMLKNIYGKQIRVKGKIVKKDATFSADGFIARYLIGKNMAQEVKKVEKSEVKE